MLQLITHPVFGYVLVALGFFGFLVVNWLIGPFVKIDALVKSNHGSRMMFFIWCTALLFLLAVVTWLSYFAFYELFSPIALKLLALTLLFVPVGAGFGLVTVLRAQDAGRSQWFALLIFVPIANLWLSLAEPDTAIKRKPYIPSGTLARFFVTLIAIAVSYPVGQLSDMAEDRLTAAIYREAAIKGVVARKASLPSHLAAHSALREIDVHMEYESILYIYDIDGEIASNTEIGAWLENVMKPEALNTLCKNDLVTQEGWHFGFRYRSAGDDLIAETDIRNRDCRKLELN